MDFFRASHEKQLKKSELQKWLHDIECRLRHLENIIDPNFPYCVYQVKNGLRSRYCHLRHLKITHVICENCKFRTTQRAAKR